MITPDMAAKAAGTEGAKAAKAQGTGGEGAKAKLAVASVGGTEFVGTPEGKAKFYTAKHAAFADPSTTAAQKHAWIQADADLHKVSLPAAQG